MQVFREFDPTNSGIVPSSVLRHILSEVDMDTSLAPKEVRKTRHTRRYCHSWVVVTKLWLCAVVWLCVPCVWLCLSVIVCDRRWLRLCRPGG